MCKDLLIIRCKLKDKRLNINGVVGGLGMADIYESHRDDIRLGGRSTKAHSSRPLSAIINDCDGCDGWDMPCDKFQTIPNSFYESCCVIYIKRTSI